MIRFHDIRDGPPEGGVRELAPEPGFATPGVPRSHRLQPKIEPIPNVRSGAVAPTRPKTKSSTACGS